MKPERIRGQGGVSLLEVLTALVITGILTTAIMKLYVVQHKNYMTQESITEMQQSARAAIDELSRQLRMAGNRLPPGVDALIPADCNPDTLVLTFRINSCETYLGSDMSSWSDDFDCATGISCFAPGEWAYIYHPDSGGGEWVGITGVDETAGTLQHTVLTQSYAQNAIVLSMQQLKYYVDNTTDTDNPCLMLQVKGQTPQVFAENVEDLQIQYRLKNGMVVDQPVLSADIREVQMAITGRTRQRDHENPDNPFMTRTYMSSVNIRNLAS